MCVLCCLFSSCCCRSSCQLLFQRRIYHLRMPCIIVQFVPFIKRFHCQSGFPIEQLGTNCCRPQCLLFCMPHDIALVRPHSHLILLWAHLELSCFTWQGHQRKLHLNYEIKFERKGWTKVHIHIPVWLWCEAWLQTRVRAGIAMHCAISSSSSSHQVPLWAGFFPRSFNSMSTGIFIILMGAHRPLPPSPQQSCLLVF